VPDQDLVAVARLGHRDRGAGVQARREARAEDLGDVLGDDDADPVQQIRAMTQGRGVDVAIEAVGKPFLELVKVELPRPLAQIENILRREGYWEYELKEKSRDGKEITVASRWTAWRRQACRRLVGVGADWTAGELAPERAAGVTIASAIQVLECMAVLPSERTVQSVPASPGHGCRWRRELA